MRDEIQVTSRKTRLVIKDVLKRAFAICIQCQSMKHGNVFDHD